MSSGKLFLNSVVQKTDRFDGESIMVCAICLYSRTNLLPIADGSQIAFRYIILEP